MSLSRNGSPTLSRSAESASASPGRLAQSFDLHAIDVEILADNEIQAHASGNVGQFGAQIRIAAGAKQFPKARAFRFHGKWLAGLKRQLGRILFQYRAGFGDHAHGDDARRLTGKTALRGEQGLRRTTRTPPAMTANRTKGRWTLGITLHNRTSVA